MVKKYNGTLYRSKWDGSTWVIIALVALCCFLPIFFDDDGYVPIIVGAAALAFIIFVLSSVYYKIDGDQLIIYQFFIPSAYPISKIGEIYPIKTYLSAPATSLTDRIAIKFTERKILKSTAPLVISPVDKAEFIAQLTAINPNIKTDIRIS